MKNHAACKSNYIAIQAVLQAEEVMLDWECLTALWGIPRTVYNGNSLGGSRRPRELLRTMNPKYSWFVDIRELGWPACNEASSENSPVRLASQLPNSTDPPLVSLRLTPHYRGSAGALIIANTTSQSSCCSYSIITIDCFIQSIRVFESTPLTPV